MNRKNSIFLLLFVIAMTSFSQTNLTDSESVFLKQTKARYLDKVQNYPSYWSKTLNLEKLIVATETSSLSEDLNYNQSSSSYNSGTSPSIFFITESDKMMFSKFDNTNYPRQLDYPSLDFPSEKNSLLTGLASMILQGFGGTY